MEKPGMGRAENFLSAKVAKTIAQVAKKTIETYIRS
jgi:hypothetical protein